MMGFTYRKQPKETGLRGVGNPYPDTDIKFHKNVVGKINAPNWMTKDGLWSVTFAVKKEATEEDPADFKWVRLKGRWSSEPEARASLNRGYDELITQLDFYTFND